jgi:hypothetical protein|nr:MAG TPA: hypothetical protein [Caudoviricetes sp.]
MNIQPIRTFKNGIPEYYDYLQDLTGLNASQIEKIVDPDHTAQYNCDYTLAITDLRIKMSEAGYAEEIKKADEKFIITRGFGRKIDFEKFWQETYESEPEFIEKYKDAI